MSNRIFRQESFFHYLFGVTEADFCGAIDLAEKKAILFIPRLPEAYAVWMGAVRTSIMSCPDLILLADSSTGMV